jgi:putative ATP-dependent endonuclease of OLD family
MVVLTNRGSGEISCTIPAEKANLQAKEVEDLERYLDATRSTLLYARKVILVEGPAELFLIPALVKKVMKIDLERLGISIIPIYGVHFKVYAKLFSSLALPKKCVIIADGDLIPSDASIIKSDEFEPYIAPNLESLKSEFINVFYCKKTFEIALTIPGLLPVLEKAAEECGASKIANELKKGYHLVSKNKEKQEEIIETLSQKILNTAKRFGKARFAQIASKYINLAEDIPDYIRSAINWLIEE